MVNVEEVAQAIVLEAQAQMTNADVALDIIFDNIMRHTITGHNHITDHYVENGTPIEDTSSVGPLIITVQGWMADLTYSMNPVARKILQYLVQTANVPIIGGIAATRLSSVLFIINAIYERVKNVISTIENINALFGNGGNSKRQSGYNLPFITFDEDKKLGYQLAVLEGLRTSRLPINLSLPRIGVFHNLYVEDYDWEQDKSYYQAKITLTLKQLRTTEVVLTRLSNSTVTQREAES